MKGLIPFIPFILIGILAFFIYQTDVKSRERSEYIEKLVDANKNVINYDSIQSAIERSIYDSLSKSIVSLQGDIETLKNQNYQLRKSNEELEKKYRSIVVDLPEL